MNLTHQDFNLFNREIFTFKQLKEQQTSAEIDDLKQTYKQHWEKWKALNLAIAQGLPAELGITKPKIESWTNGWNLRSHFWVAYRSEQRQAENACLALLLNKKQFQVYLMFQHYKSEEREGSVVAYNQLLNRLEAWSQTIDCEGYYIWPQEEHELVDHLPLKDYLADENNGKF